MFKIKEEEKIDLLEWCRSDASPQDDKMFYKDAAWKQIIFVRDTLPIWDDLELKSTKLKPL